MVTFQTTYLKKYYPQEFMAALLTSEQDNTDKVVKYIDEVKRLGIKLSPPSVKKSFIEFTAIKDDEGDETILFGLGALKGMGSSAITKILEAREDENFKDLDDFLSKIDTSKVNKRVIESLTKSGSLDDFSYTRRALLDNIEKIVETASECARAKKMAENSLFGDDKELTSLHVDIDNVAEFDMKKILEFEKDTMGFYVSGHPLDEFREEIDGIDYTLSSEVENLGDGSKTLFIGKVEEIVEKISKKGNKFAILNLMDFHGNIEITLFAKHLEKIQNMNKEEPICLKVIVTRDDRGVNKRVLKILNLKDAKKEKIDTKVVEVAQDPKTLIIDFSEDSKILEDVYRLVRENPGNRPLKLIIASKLQDVVLDTYLKVSDEIDEKIKDIDLVKVA
jgi:DNA polymerase-3 subunit alpha